MKRLGEEEKNLLKRLPDDGTKLSLTMDAWSASNRQSYLAIIAFFIDHHWEYHEVLLGFENFIGKHSGQKIASLVEKTLNVHKVLHRVLAITTDNASNNKTFLASFSRHIDFTIVTYHSPLDDIFEEEDQEKDDDDDVNNVELNQGRPNASCVDNSALTEHVPCLAHVLQLAVKALLGTVRANPTNEELQKNWTDDVDRPDSTLRGLPMTLAKVTWFLRIFLFIHNY
jgi:hypothetical protein